MKLTDEQVNALAEKISAIKEEQRENAIKLAMADKDIIEQANEIAANAIEFHNKSKLISSHIYVTIDGYGIHTNNIREILLRNLAIDKIGETYNKMNVYDIRRELQILSIDTDSLVDLKSKFGVSF